MKADSAVLAADYCNAGAGRSYNEILQSTGVEGGEDSDCKDRMTSRGHHEVIRSNAGGISGVLPGRMRIPEIGKDRHLVLDEGRFFGYDALLQ
jgi:hypothetical protein